MNEYYLQLRHYLLREALLDYQAGAGLSISPVAPGPNSIPAISQLWKYLFPCLSSLGVLSFFGGRVCAHPSQHSSHPVSTYKHSRSSRNLSLEDACSSVFPLQYHVHLLAILSPTLLLGIFIAYVRHQDHGIDTYNIYIQTLYADAYIYTYVNIHVCIYMPTFVIIS